MGQRLAPGRVRSPACAGRAQRLPCPARSIQGSLDRKSTRLNSSHLGISYAVFCLKKKKKQHTRLHNDKTQKKNTNQQSATLPNTYLQTPQALLSTSSHKCTTQYRRRQSERENTLY